MPFELTKPLPRENFVISQSQYELHEFLVPYRATIVPAAYFALILLCLKDKSKTVNDPKKKQINVNQKNQINVNHSNLKVYSLKQSVYLKT